MAKSDHYDAIIIGAGISGMYMSHKLRELGMSFRVFEAGTGVGGTWYWNRYPGARFDSESYSYAYSFSDEILDEWEWSEHFAAQPETLRYLNFVADKLDLRHDIEFSTRIVAASYDEASNTWEVETEQGKRARATFLITAIGPLSVPYVPAFKGIDTFKGQSFHTGSWPHEPVDLRGKRVGIIGTGATAVQVITEIAKTVGYLTVFQKEPNFCVPLRNKPIDAETQKELKANAKKIFDQCKATFGQFIHGFDERSALEVSPEEREAFFEKLYAEPGFALWLSNYHDIFSSREANDLITEFVSEKIRERIDDPEVAAKLIPKDHGFGTKRVPMESGYYEVYNQDNVLLVDVNENPIEYITEKGVQCRDGEYEFDLIIYATGFDAVTGGFMKMDIRGVDGQSLRDKWADGPRTYLGLQTAGFPNLMTIVGPHNGGTFCNIPRCIEQNVEWVADLLRYMRDHDYHRISATPEAEDAWTEHVYDAVSETLIPETDSWFIGANIPGKKKTFLMYAGGMPTFRERCDEVAANGYEGFALG